MDRCPKKETLEKFIDFELTEEMNENIFKHLQLCNDCKHTIRCLLSDEKHLLRSFVKKPIHYKSKTMSSSERCLSKEAMLAYATESLNENQLKLVESHLEKCDNCLIKLIRLQRALSLPSETELDMTALMATERGVSYTGFDILEITLKAKGKLLELISHTGELLYITPQTVIVRGKKQKHEDSIIIRKDFTDRDVSVEITINRELTEPGCNIKISIMRLSTEESVSETDVSLSGEEIHQHGKTDKEGIIEFYGLKIGEYDIKVCGKSLALVSIK